MVFILFQRWKLGLRTVGSGGLEPGHIQSPCPVGNQGLLQTLGAGELCDQGWGRGLQREVDWTSRRAAHTPPPGFPGVGSDVGSGCPTAYPPLVCMRAWTYTSPYQHTSLPPPQHDPTPGLCCPRSWLRGSHACSLGAVLGRPLGPSEAELVLRAESGHPGGQDGGSGQWGSLAVCLGAGPGGGGDRGPEGI